MDEEHDDPYHGLPPELRAMLEQLGGSAGGLGALFGGLGSQHAPIGTVDWSLATRVAVQLAAEGDRAPTEEERSRAQRALDLAEHWLDATGLPAPADAGRLVVADRQTWSGAALDALRALVEPVAGASVRALTELARDQLREFDVDDLEHLGIALPPGVQEMLGGLFSSDVDLTEMLRPAGAMLTGLQVGQVIGALSRQILGQYDLGIPTAPRGHAYQLAVNVDDTFGDWDLDPTDVAVVLAVNEAAHRRLYHAVDWLEPHVHGLVGEFASGIRVDPERLEALTDDLLTGVDPDDEDALRAAMERAAMFRLEPTPAQVRVLERLQAVVALTGAWARSEARRAIADRVPSVARIDEVLRRRRAVRGDGEALLANLLGLDLKPADESVAEQFVETVTEILGSAGLHRALAHPENLPDTAELEDPVQWLERTSPDAQLPDDLATMFAGLGDAPVEASADERVARAEEAATDSDGTDDEDAGDDRDDGPDDAEPGGR